MRFQDDVAAHASVSSSVPMMRFHEDVAAHASVSADGLRFQELVLFHDEVRFHDDVLFHDEVRFHDDVRFQDDVRRTHASVRANSEPKKVVGAGMTGA